MGELRFILAGGGTSGHINPALAIADQIRQDHPQAQILFCGTRRGLEQTMVPRAGYEFRAIRARGLPHRLSPELVRAVADFIAGRRQCRQLLREFKPNAVIGTGGYVCSPLAAAAASLHVPLLLHEQNAFPGRSNRLMARRSQMVCISFPGSETWFKTRAPIVLTGNPVRPEFFAQNRQAARKILGLAEHEPVILAMGGSLGARSINEAVLGLHQQPAFRALLSCARPPRVILAAGRQHFEAVRQDSREMTWLDVHEYLFDMPQVMAAADLIIGRAGAMTCAELAALGKPAILIPYPHAAGDHQTSNARVLASAGAALLQPDQDLTAEWLAGQLQSLLHDRLRLLAMGEAAARLAQPAAAAQICRCLYQVMQA